MPKNTKKKNQKDTKDPVKLKVIYLTLMCSNLFVCSIGAWKQSILKQKL